MTPEEKILADEEQVKKDQERWDELQKKPKDTLTTDEVKEKVELQERYGKRMQSKIDKEVWARKSAEERAEKAEQDRIDLEARLKDLEEKVPKEIAPAVEDSFIVIGERKWLTDEALIVKIQNKEITEAEAYRYQRNRDKEELKLSVKKELEGEKTKGEDLKTRKEDSEAVLKQYPHFSNKDPNFNPNDPLYKLANEIYLEGYAANPKGLSLSIKRAKEILKITDEPLDRSHELGVERGGSPGRIPKEKEVNLTPEEEDIAVRTFCKGDVLNSKTGRPYTVAEAKAKALEAKKTRARKE